MKNRVISSIVFILLGAFIILTPTVLFRVCDSTEMKMSCYYTKHAEIGVGAVIAALGLLSLFTKDVKIRIGYSVSQLLNAALVLALPLKLTGICKMKSMDCQVRTLPALIVGTAFIAIAAIVNIIYLSRKGKEQ